MARAKRARDCRGKTLGQCYLGGAVHYGAILAVTPTGILSVVALLTNKYKCKGQKGLGLQGQKPLGQWVKAILGGAVHYWAMLAVALLTKKYDGKGQKGSSSQGQKPLGQCCLGSAVHNLAILAVTLTGILSVVALLTNKYDGKGQKGLGLQGQSPCAILVELFITEPSWRWPLLGFFLL